MIQITKNFRNKSVPFQTLISIFAVLSSKLTRHNKAALATLLFLGFATLSFAQESESFESKEHLIYFEADPLAYINKGYSLHFGYENWGMRFDLTTVEVDFPERFEDAFYGTTAFDLISIINGIKIDYIGERADWTKGAFIGLDINHQTLDFTHRESGSQNNLTAFNIGMRTGYKFDIYKGFYITPWTAVWKNVTPLQTFEVESESITTNSWDWLITFHVGYAYKF